VDLEFIFNVVEDVLSKMIREAKEKGKLFV
jgi:hypothetical protein